MEKKFQIYKRYRYIPLYIIDVYISATLLLYLFGPWEYDNNNDLKLVIYIILFLVISSICYFMGNRVKFKVFKNKKRGKWNVYKIVKYALIASCIEKILLLLSCIVQYGMINLGNISMTLAQTYQRMYQGAFASENIIRQIDGMLGWLYLIAVCGGLYLWDELEKKYKVLIGVNILCALLYNLGYLGVQKNIFDNLIYIALAVVIRFLKKNKKIFTPKRIVLYLLLIIGGVLILANFMATRRTLTQMGNLSSSFDYNHILIRYLPDSLKLGVGILLSYGTMGYNYLAKALTLPFKWTYGLGSMWGVNQIFTQLFQVQDFYPISYGGRLFTYAGIDAKAKWITIFPWLASDFTYIGALVVMGIVAFMLAKCWKEILIDRNIISYIMLTRFAILYFYILANNQLFITKGEAVTTIMIVMIWLFDKKNWRCKDKCND